MQVCQKHKHLNTNIDIYKCCVPIVEYKNRYLSELKESINRKKQEQIKKTERVIASKTTPKKKEADDNKIEIEIPTTPEEKVKLVENKLLAITGHFEQQQKIEKTIDLSVLHAKGLIPNSRI